MQQPPPESIVRFQEAMTKLADEAQVLAKEAGAPEDEIGPAAVALAVGAVCELMARGLRAIAREAGLSHVPPFQQTDSEHRLVDHLRAIYRSIKWET